MDEDALSQGANEERELHISILKDRDIAIKHRDTSLKYGDSGTAEFQVGDREWTFSRQRSSAPVLRRLSNFATIIPSPAATPKLITSSGSSRTTQGDPDFVGTHPEAAVVSDFILRDEQLSRAIINTATIYDPVSSHRLVRAHAIIPLTKRRVPITAFAAGKDGSQVRFVVIQDQKYGWYAGSRGTALILDEFGDQDAWWDGGGAPILQIKAAMTSHTVDEPDAWIAVQLPNSTTVFRPQFRKDVLSPFRAVSAVHGAHSSSRLQPNPVATLPVSRTGGSIHTNVEFNPWYPQQLAVIDAKMNWSVWDIELLQGARDVHHLVPHTSGTLSSDTDDSNDHSYTDNIGGWARVCWVASDKLLLCNRRTVTLYHIEGENTIEMEVSGRLIIQGAEYILDVRIIPNGTTGVLFLTTKRVIWVQVRTDIQSARMEERVDVLETLLSWRHFRSVDDFTLGMDILGVAENALVVLYSRLNNLIHFFHFGYSSNDSSLPVSVSDPFIITIPDENNSPSNSTRPNQFSTLRFQTVKYASTPDTLPNDPGAKYESMGIIFCKITVLTNDLSVRECFFAFNNVEISNSVDFQNIEISLPENKRTAKLYGRALGKSKVKSAEKITDEDFIVGDDEDFLFSCGKPAPTAYGVDLSAAAGRDSKRTIQKVRSQWAVNSGSVYELAAGLINENGEEVKPRLQDFVVWVKNIRDLPSASKNTSNLQTLVEMQGSTPHVNDLHDASENLVRLLDESLGTEALRLSLVDNQDLWLSPRSAGDLRPTNTTLSVIYDHLVRCWLASLPPNVPDRVRVAKERVLRSVAAELSLARVVLRPRDNRATLYSQSDSLAISGLQLPVRSKNPRFQDTETKPSTQLKNPRTSAVSESSQVTSSQPISESDPSDGTAGDDENQTFSYLRAYTSLSSHPHLPKSVAALLKHWEIGTDPNFYSWSATTAHLSAPTVEQSRANEREAQRLRKKADEERAMPGRLEFVSNDTLPAVRKPITAESQKLFLASSSQLADDPMSSMQQDVGFFGSSQSLGKGLEREKKRSKNKRPGFN